MEITTGGRSRRLPVFLSSAATLVVRWAVLVMVCAVPLLLDLADVDDTYYGIKARALLILAAAVAVGAVVARGWRRLAVPGYVRPFLAFIAAAAIATVLAVDRPWAVWGSPWRHEGLLVLMAYAVVGLGSIAVASTHPAAWRLAVVTGAAATASYGIAQYFGYEWLLLDPARRWWTAAFSTTGHPNYLASYMTLTFPFAAAAAVASQRRGAAALWTAAALIIYAAGLFAYSRAGWAGMGTVLIVMTVAILRGSPGGGMRRWAGMLLLVGALTVVFLIPHGPLAGRSPAAPLTEARTVLGSENALGFSDRLYLWSEAISLAARRPLFGYGPETFVLVLPNEWDAPKPRFWGMAPRTIDKAHNDTLDTIISLGLAGLAAYWWIIAASVRSSLWLLRAGAADRIFGAASLAAVSGYLLTFQFGFSVVSVAPIFWSVLGALIGRRVALGGSS